MMDDFGNELEEIRREIVESRSLSIKTNNLVNALSADVNSIAKRQQNYERGLKWNSAVVPGPDHERIESWSIATHGRIWQQIGGGGSA